MTPALFVVINTVIQVDTIILIFVHLVIQHIHTQNHLFKAVLFDQRTEE